jgi:glycerophosphoryl diester phosphodiesterase
VVRRWGRDGGPTLILGHRGASAHAVENTLAAFRRARADGADGVELDVMTCADGEVVVFHDDDLTRLASRAERIAAMPLSALREVRLEGGEGIPTLEEVLEELGPELLVNVELKVRETESGRRLVGAVAAILRRQPALRRILVSSFHPAALGWFRAVLPDCASGLLFGPAQSRWLRDAWSRVVLRPLALHPEHTLVDDRSVRRWHGEGHAIHVWTVDDPVELLRVAACGVDGIITNDPAAARTTLAHG